MLVVFCTRLIDSTPPATMTGTRSTITRCAAMLTAIRPELQKRLMVSPATVTGKSGADRRQARDVVAGGALGEAAADDDVLDLAGIDLRALDGVLDHVAGQAWRHGSC